MTLAEALVLGVVQGATEFLPVSSSGHLALAQSALGVRGPTLLFDVVVHLGTLGAVLWAFRERVGRLALAGWRLGRAVDADGMADRRWLALIAVSCVPTAILGLGLESTVLSMLDEPRAVGIALLVTAALLVFGERIGSRTRGPEAMRVADALWIGAAQGLAVVPGLSRSGSTISVALWRGVSAEAAVSFSLLASVPAILGANLLVATRELPGLDGEALAPLAVGFAAAFGAGYLSLRALQWAVVRRRLMPFAAYCVALGVGAIVIG